MCVQKNLGLEKCFGSNEIAGQKLLGLEKILGLKNIMGPKKNWVYKSLALKHLVQKKLCPPKNRVQKFGQNPTSKS